MHELQMMQTVIRMVEETCQNQANGLPSLVRVHIGSHSHLAEHTPQELETTFHLAATGTQVQDAKLDVVTIMAKGECQDCGLTVARSSHTIECPKCKSGNIRWEDLPEVVLKEIEWVEDSEGP